MREIYVFFGSLFILSFKQPCKNLQSISRRFLLGLISYRVKNNFSVNLNAV